MVLPPLLAAGSLAEPIRASSRSCTHQHSYLWTRTFSKLAACGPNGAAASQLSLTRVPALGIAAEQPVWATGDSPVGSRPRGTVSRAHTRVSAGFQEPVVSHSGKFGVRQPLCGSSQQPEAAHR